MGFKLTMLVVIGTDCTGNCKTNYRTIMSMTVSYKEASYIFKKTKYFDFSGDRH